MRPLVSLFAFLLFAAYCPAGAQQPGGVELVPEDRAVLEVQAPAGAKIRLDDRDYGQQQRIVVSDFKPNETRAARVEVTLTGGGRVERQVLLEAGHKVLLPIRPPARRPHLALQTGHTAVLCMVPSPDGAYLLTGGADQRAILWEFATGRQLQVYPGHGSVITNVEFSSDGQRVLTVGAADVAMLWDRATGRRLHTFSLGPNQSVFAGTLSRDGRQVATAHGGGLVVLWDCATGEKLRTLRGHTDTAICVAFSPNGRQLLSGSYDKSAILWDLRTGQKVRDFGRYDGRVSDVAVLDKQVLLSVGEHDRDQKKYVGELVLWDLDGEVPSKRHTLDAKPISFRVSPSGRQMCMHIASGSSDSQDHELQVWNLETFQVTWRKSPGWGSTFSHDESKVLMNSEVGVTFFNSATGQVAGELATRQDAVISTCFVRDDHFTVGTYEYALSANLDTGAKRWLFQVPIKLSELLVGEQTVSADGRRVGLVKSGHETWEVMVLEAESGDVLKKFMLPEKGPAWSIDLSRNGQTLLVKMAGKPDLHICDVERSEWRKLAFHYTQAATLTPDGRYAVVCGRSQAASKNAIELWDLESLQRVREFETPFASFLGNDLSISARGDYLLAGGSATHKSAPSDGRAVLWHFATGKVLHTFENPTRFNKTAFSPDGRRLLVRTWDSKAYVYETASGRPLRALPRLVRMAAFDATGRRLLAATADGAAALIDLATGDELVRTIWLNQGRDWLTVTPEGLFDGTEAARKRLAFRIEEGLSLVPVDRFFQDFYRPGLWAQIMAGERPMPVVELGADRAPQVTITSPQAGPVTTSTATIEIEAVDQGGGVANLAIFHNGARVVPPGESRQQGGTLHRSFRLSLVGGRNEVRVVATNRDGSWESEPASIVLSYDKQVGKSRLELVVVGVNRYSGSLADLRYAAADARALGELFRRRGPQLYGEVAVTELMDGNATKPRIKQVLRDVAGRTRPDDTLILFMAGHGAMVGQRYYFVPAEFHRSASRVEEDLREQGLAADEISELIGTAQALKRVLILDTCASGGALGMMPTGRSGFALRGAIERLSYSQGIFTIAAASASQEAQESPTLGHGVLSYALLAGLRGVTTGPLADKSVPTANSERVVEMLEWLNFAAGQVPRLTGELFGLPQDVQIGIEGQNFPVLPLDDPAN